MCVSSTDSLPAVAGAATGPLSGGGELAWRLAPTPMLLVAQGGAVLAANPAAVALLQCPELELQRQGLAGLAPADAPWPWPAGAAAAELEATWQRPGAPPCRLALAWGPSLEQGGQQLRCVALTLATEVAPAGTPLERELLHDRILDLLHDGVLLYDEGLHFLGANRSAQRILGLAESALAGRSADTLGWRQIREDGRPMPLQERPVWRVAHGQESVEAVTLGVDTGDGRVRWLLINAVRTAPLVPGQRMGVVASFADISRQVEAMQALRESDQRFRLFAEHSQDVIWISDPCARRVLYVSPAYDRIWGRSGDDLLADHGQWMQAIHPDDRQVVSDAYFSALERGHYAAEYRIQRPDGKTLWIRDRGFPICDLDGQLTHLAGIAEDITAAHQAAGLQRQRLDTEARLSRLVATAPGALFTYRLAADGQVQVQLANARVLQAYGLDRAATPATAQVQARLPDIRDVILPDDRARLLQARDVSARSLKAWREEFRVRHPRRGEIWVELHAMPVQEPDGAVAWHGFLHDIHARKQMEQEILRINQDLEARVAERTEELQARHREMEAFTYSVSHDLKAPLRGIDGYSRLLLIDHADKLDEEGRLFVETIRKATVHMGRLIDDLLAYSRVERSRPVLGPLDPSALIRQLVGERQRELQAEGVELVLALDGSGAIGERDGLAMAVRNLLDNAMKFTAGRPARRIEIRCEACPPPPAGPAAAPTTAAAARCRISVADNGPGFDMRYHDRIFEIFQRLHRAEDYPGTGVGLAIVRKAVERMHGRVWADSAPGQGARFSIELPA